MDFFAAQERARKQTRRLVLWFALCLLGVVVSIYALVLVAQWFSGISADAPHDAGVFGADRDPVHWWQPDWFLGTFVVVGGLILIGSLTKLAKLSSGGRVVAQNLGGRQVDPSTTDLNERRLLNVVEEMAIASGTPVPEVWVMDDESGINAFAAGTDPTNAVVGVTRGTLERLSRSELQGVIAHEFSHILNGDMTLNMRLMGWTFGLVMISVIGRLMMHAIRGMRGSRNDKGGGVILAIVVIGLAVWIIGSIGVLFARILQASISRQREFLADASAVQFTRDPSGISGALKKIGGFSGHGAIQAAEATEARHLFFASSSLGSLLATHPPLDERIKAIDPQWDGRMLKTRVESALAGGTPGAMGLAGVALSPRELPDSKDTAKARLMAMLIPADQQDIGRHTLAGHGIDLMLADEAIHQSNELQGATLEQKLVLLAHSMPWLRRMTPREARELVAVCQALAEADGRITLFEFMLLQVIRRHIQIGLGLEPVPAMRHRKIEGLARELGCLLAVFRSVSDNDRAVTQALVEYKQHTGHQLVLPDPDFTAAARALSEMDAATPLVKKQILRLCALAVTEDGVVNERESQLMRATSEALGVPVPRMVDDPALRSA